MKKAKSWKTIQKELQALRLKHGKDRSCIRQFPDLSFPKKGTPCTNGMSGSTHARGVIPGAKEFPIGNLHKSGLQLITPGSDPRAFAGSKVTPDGFQKLLNILRNPWIPVDAD